MKKTLFSSALYIRPFTALIGRHKRALRYTFILMASFLLFDQTQAQQTFFVEREFSVGQYVALFSRSPNTTPNYRMGGKIGAGLTIKGLKENKTHRIKIGLLSHKNGFTGAESNRNLWVEDFWYSTQEVYLEYQKVRRLGQANSKFSLLSKVFGLGLLGYQLHGTTGTTGRQTTTNPEGVSGISNVRNARPLEKSPSTAPTSFGYGIGLGLERSFLLKNEMQINFSIGTSIQLKSRLNFESGINHNPFRIEFGGNMFLGVK